MSSQLSWKNGSSKKVFLRFMGTMEDDCCVFLSDPVEDFLSTLIFCPVFLSRVEDCSFFSLSKEDLLDVFISFSTDDFLSFSMEVFLMEDSDLVSSVLDCLCSTGIFLLSSLISWIFFSCLPSMISSPSLTLTLSSDGLYPLVFRDIS